MNSHLNIHPDFPSKHIPPRQIEVWLPPTYEQHSSEQRYPVLYMHDGQNLFNPETAYTGITWGINEALTMLIEAADVPEPIVVGIWNGEARRRQEYMPQRPFDSPKGAEMIAQHPDEIHLPIESDSYLRFIVTELKPFIDKEYRTRPEQEHTTIMGSSMGGLISLYALCEYPDVFSAAGCLSTHWPPVHTVFLDYLHDHLPTPGRHRLYFDYGTETLDAHYEQYQNIIDDLLRDHGYTEGQNWLTLRFEGADHSEKAWRERIHVPLKFVLWFFGI